uniref:Uncharacterized protein n=1 Tax=Meloidogyne enterolobii TaxID=390850 RepID=A0A6V7UQH6_MELEN|nr:unnamed protein product [Meloidogyne enterolobii]
MKQNYYFIFFCLLQHFILNVNCLENHFFVKVLPIGFKWKIDVECPKCAEIEQEKLPENITMFTLSHNGNNIKKLKIKITSLEEGNHAEMKRKIKNINFDKLYKFDFFGGKINNKQDIPSYSFGYSEDDPIIKNLIKKLEEENAELKRKAANEGSSSSSYGTNTDDNDDNSKFGNLSITPNKVPKPKRKGNKNSKIGNVSPSSQGSSNDNESIHPVHPPLVHPHFGHGFEYGYSNSYHNSVDGGDQLPYHETTMAGSGNGYGNFGGIPNYGWSHPYPYNSSGFPPNFVPIQPQPNEITHFADTNTGM